MALSKIQKAAMAETATKMRQSRQRAIGKVSDQLGKASAKLREERKVRAGESLAVGAGTFAFGAVASQIHREIAIKRESPTVAKVLNYAGAAIGVWMAAKAKPTASGMRMLGASMAGLGAGQAAIDFQAVDLVPGLND
jgi:hypothetical protein